MIIEGPNGYVSPSFYEAEPYVPTWNFLVAHLHGIPEILAAEEAFEVLEATVDHFESGRPKPWDMSGVQEYAHRIAPGVTGFRFTPDRVVSKAKVSQEKPREVALRVVRALDSGDDFHRNPELANAMRRYSASTTEVLSSLLRAATSGGDRTSPVAADAQLDEVGRPPCAEHQGNPGK
ncbi:FMN-binding negative transcriptional regulator [Streptomyces sp. NPDC002851]